MYQIKLGEKIESTSNPQNLLPFDKEIEKLGGNDDAFKMKQW